MSFHVLPDQGPVGVSISFDRHAVIYEDAYTNLPGAVVHPVRGNTLPQNVRIEPGSSRSYEVEYSVLEPSGSATENMPQFAGQICTRW